MSDYGKICDRCRKPAATTWVPNLRAVLCAACLKAWEVLQYVNPTSE